MMNTCADFFGCYVWRVHQRMTKQACILAAIQGRRTSPSRSRLRKAHPEPQRGTHTVLTRISWRIITVLKALPGAEPYIESNAVSAPVNTALSKCRQLMILP